MPFITSARKIASPYKAQIVKIGEGWMVPSEGRRREIISPFAETMGNEKGVE